MAFRRGLNPGLHGDLAVVVGTGAWLVTLDGAGAAVVGTGAAVVGAAVGAGAAVVYGDSGVLGSPSDAQRVSSIPWALAWSAAPQPLLMQAADLEVNGALPHRHL